MGFLKEHQNKLIAVFLVAVALGVIGYGPSGVTFNPGAISGALPAAAAEDVPTTGAGAGATKVIQYSGSVTQTFSVEDKYTGTAVDVEGVIFRGNDRIYNSSAVNSTTDSLNKGETVTFIAWDDTQTGQGHATMVDGTATAIDNTDDWYMTKDALAITMDQDEDSKTYQLVKEGQASISIINSNGATLNASGAQEDLSAGDQKTLTIKLSGPSEAAFGAPDSTRGIGISLEALKTLYESITIVGATSVPGYQCDNSVQYTTNNKWEYELDTKSLENSEEITLKLVVKVKSGQSPSDLTADINYSIADPAGFYYEDAPIGASLEARFPYDVCDRTDLGDVGTYDLNGTIFVN